MIVGWTPPALAKPLMVAVGKDGSRLSELGPDDFLDSHPGILDGVAMPTMIAAGMPAMKQRFPTLRNGRP